MHTAAAAADESASRAAAKQLQAAERGSLAVNKAVERVRGGASGSRASSPIDAELETMDVQFKPIGNPAGGLSDDDSDDVRAPAHADVVV